jgi:hypothetical protein
MYLPQSLIMFAVVGSNVHWQWTPNHYVPPLFGAILAYGVTWLCQARRAVMARF